MKIQKEISLEEKNKELYNQGISKIQLLKTEIKKHIIGQDKIINKLLIGLLTGGHILLEGLPGLAKTSIVKTIANCINLESQRIQFTTDLLPSDIIGTLIYNQHNQDFVLKKGPVFTDILIADEINRAPSKVQSALLESMQEKQVTIDRKTYKLHQDFWVIATENPIENEATYELPEAQLDRFMLKLKISYPKINEEKEIVLKSLEKNIKPINKVLEKQDINFFKQLINSIYIDLSVIEYIINIVDASRNPLKFNIKNNNIKFGASPRASIYLALASKTTAFINKRNYVTIDDVKEITKDVLRHRIILSYEAQAEEITSDEIISEILETLETI